MAKKKKKVKVNNIIDMLSDLPDCIIIHILSFLNTKQAVRTCILSIRWKDLWKHLPALIFHRSDFETFEIFSKFVPKLLCSPVIRLIKRVVIYANSPNVHQIGLFTSCNIQQILPTKFSCHTLTYLKLSIYPKRTAHGDKTLFPKSLHLPSLTILHLENFAFCAGDNGCAEPFSAFEWLNRLTLLSFAVKGATTLYILNERLVHLCLINLSCDFFEIELCTPWIGTLYYTGKPYQKVFGSGLSYVERVDIDAHVLSLDIEPPLLLLSWLSQLDNTKSLTVTASTLQTKFLSLGNLKLLKVKRIPLMYEFRQRLIEAKIQKIKSREEADKLRKSFKAGLEPSAPIPDGIVDFLIQNSPSAKVEIIDYS